MGFTQSITSIGLGGIMAWLILSFFQAKKTVSYYTQLRPWPLEEDNSNLALVGVGLATAKPKSSVMDATPSSPQVMIMEPSPMVEEAPSPLPAMAPEVVHIAVPTYPAPVASSSMESAPSPMSMAAAPAPMGSPLTITPAPSPSA
jgi:hypothetical protein